jgi:hypothetical protein
MRRQCLSWYCALSFVVTQHMLLKHVRDETSLILAGNMFRHSSWHIIYATKTRAWQNNVTSIFYSDLTYTTFQKMSNNHAWRNCMRIDDNIGNNTVPCKWHWNSRKNGNAETLSGSPVCVLSQVNALVSFTSGTHTKDVVRMKTSLTSLNASAAWRRADYAHAVIVWPHYYGAAGQHAFLNNSL